MLEIAVVDAPLYQKYGQIVSQKLSESGILPRIIRVGNIPELHSFLAENKNALGICKANMMNIQNTSLANFSLFKREDARALLLGLSEEIHLENFVRAMKIATESKIMKGYLSHYFPHLEIIYTENSAKVALENLQTQKYDAYLLPHFFAESYNLLPYKLQKMNVMAFVPECGDGVVGIFGQKDGEYKDFCRQHFHHQVTEILFQTEMTFAQEIHQKGDYASFAFATSIGESLSLTAGIVAEDGCFLYKSSYEGQISQIEKIGKSLAFRILENL